MRTEMFVLSRGELKNSLPQVHRRAIFSEAVAKASVGNNASKRLLAALAAEVQELLSYVAGWQEQHEKIAPRCYVEGQSPGRLVVAVLSTRDAFDFEMADLLQKLSDDLSDQFNSFEIETIQVPESSLQEFLRATG